MMTMLITNYFSYGDYLKRLKV